METTIDYGRDRENPSATIFHGMNDYGAEASDYQTTMDENPSATIDYDGLARGKLCPLKQGIGIDHWRECDGPRCAWWDADKERCAVLSLARNK